MTGKKTLAEQLAGMDLFGMSKCELLRELSGVHCCEKRGYSDDATPCSECREKQRLALIARIEEESREERTCRISEDFAFACEISGAIYTTRFSCGHFMESTIMKNEINYCPTCGARVVE